MDIRLICLDLDGTALRNDHQTISPRLARALEQAYRQGIAIVPITGRQYGLLPRFLQEHPVWEGYGVLCNGAQIRELGTGKLLFERNISREALEMLAELSVRYCLPMEFSIDSTLYLTRQSWELQLPYPNLAFHRDTILAHHGRIVDSLTSLCGEAVEKGNLMCISEDIREQVLQDLKSIPVSAVWASRTSMEITHPDACKGNGLQQLCRLMDIPTEQVMALGDSGNDESMLRLAGLSVAMGNAPDAIKALADVVTDTNERDGAAIAIEQYALKG